MSWASVPYQTKERWKEAKKLRKIANCIQWEVSMRTAEGWEERDRSVTEEEYDAVLKVVKSLRTRADKLEVGC